MPVIVQRRRKLLLFACGKYPVPSRTPFRQATKTVRLATGMAFAFTTEYCSDSQRNGVRLQTGIAFIFDRIPQGEKVIRRLAAEGVRFRVGSSIAGFVITFVCDEQARAIRDRREFKSIVSQSQS
jgi:hypothetical protein